MKKITRIDAPMGSRPACVHTVRVAAGLKTGTAKARQYRQAKRGQPINQCGRPAYFAFDGVALCAAHAGGVALEILLGDDQIVRRLREAMPPVDWEPLGRHEIAGRGPVLSGINPFPSDPMGRRIRVDGKVWRIWGVETFGGRTWLGAKVGFLVVADEADCDSSPPMS